MEQMSQEERTAFAKAGAAARWKDGRPEVHQVVRKMLNEIAAHGNPKVLYVQGKTAWYAEPGHFEEGRWTDYCVGTYGPGATFTTVIEDVLAD